MSNGYLVAAEADIAAAHTLGDGFELEVLEFTALGDAAAPTLANAANVGLLLSEAAARDAGYVALVRTLATQLPRAQLILVDANARAQFGFLPQDWPTMPLDEALRRATELKRRREPPPPEPEPEPPRHAAPIEPPVQEQQASASEEEIAPPVSEEPPAPVEDERERGTTTEPPTEEAAQSAPSGDDGAGAPVGEAAPEAHAEESEASQIPVQEDDAWNEPAAEHADAPATEDAPSPPAKAEPPPAEASTDELKIEPPAPPQAAPAPAPSIGDATSSSENGLVTGATRSRGGGSADYQAGLRGGLGASALTADASAFAPKKLRREAPELVRVVIYQPHQLKEVLKAAKKIDPRAEAAPQGMHVGEVAVGESVGVALEVKGAACDGTVQRRVWRGEPIDFSFTVEAEADVKQAVIIARVFVGDAQVGVIGFTRPISGPAKKAASGDRLKLKRHKRVFISYSSNDRQTVSAIATAYEAAGVTYFWDRSSLKSGEEWSPRLRKEIDRADLFHLCWSKAAAKSEWVEKETEHALTRRRRSNGKQPDITVQMLDGPPWAPHPRSLDSINFDDFVRAAVVGYARGDGGETA